MTYNIMNLLFNGMTCNYGNKGYYNMGGNNCSSFVGSLFNLLGGGYCPTSTGSVNCKNSWQTFALGAVVAFADWGIGKLFSNAEKKEAEAKAAEEAAKKAAEEAAKAQEKKDNENTVRQVLENNNIEAPDEIIEQIVEKYPTMKTIQTGGLTPEQRIVNYAKGLLGTQKWETTATTLVANPETAQEDIILTTVQEAIDANDTSKFKEAFLQLAREQIEVYDTNNDGQISFEEFAAEEKAKADAVKEDLYNEIATKAMFNAFNVNNEDSNIDANEMASLIYAVAKINDTDENKTAGNITKDEINTILNALQVIGLGADFSNITADNITNEQVLALGNLINNNKDKIIASFKVKEKFLQVLKNGYEGFTGNTSV